MENNNIFANNAGNLFQATASNTQQKDESENDHSKLVQRREDNAIEIRKEKRNKDLNKRRQLDSFVPSQNSNTGNAPKIHIADETLRNNIEQWLKKTFTLQSDLQQLIDCINSNDVHRQHYGVIGLRKILSVEDGPPIQSVIDANLVPTLIQFIQGEHPHLQLESAWALTNIASGTNHQTQTIIDKGAIPIFVKLLKSQYSEISEQAIWALGNIAGDCAIYRDMILKSGGLDPLIKIISNATNKNTIKHGTWALSNLCRGRPLPDFRLVQNSIPILSQVIIKSQESEVLTDAAWAISYLSDGDENRIDMVIKTGIIPSLVKLLEHPHLSILIPSLRTLGNIVTGNANQTNIVLSQEGAIDQIFELLNHEKKSVRRETCWTISNITAGTADQIHLIIQKKEYIEKLMSLMEQDAPEIVRESTWVLSNATAQGAPDDVKALVDMGIMQAFVQQLNSTDAKTIAVVLEAINNILNCGQQHFKVDGQNMFMLQLEAMGAVERIEDLQEHENEDIYKKSLRILETHFELQEVI